MAQSTYATATEIQANSITPAVAQRFGLTAIESAINAASSIADSYIVAQFTLPLKTSPQGWDASLTLAVCNIATYLLFCQFGFNPNAAADKFIEDRYNRAISWLEQIRDEKIFPTWTDSGGAGPGTNAALESGPYVISDQPVGFTSRGLTNTIGCNNNDPWAW